MKYIAFFVFVASLTVSVAAGPAEDRASAAQSRKDTIALLRQGKLTESKQRLNAALAVDPSPGANELALGRQWVMIAFDLHARGEITIAKQAAQEAVAVAVSASRIPGVSPERASLLSNTGLLCERVLRNVIQAKAFYDAALIAHPGSQQAKQLQRIADDRLKRAATAKKS